MKRTTDHRPGVEGPEGTTEPEPGFPSPAWRTKSWRDFSGWAPPAPPPPHFTFQSFNWSPLSLSLSLSLCRPTDRTLIISNCLHQSGAEYIVWGHHQRSA